MKHAISIIVSTIFAAGALAAGDVLSDFPYGEDAAFGMFDISQSSSEKASAHADFTAFFCRFGGRDKAFDSFFSAVGKDPLSEELVSTAESIARSKEAPQDFTDRISGIAAKHPEAAHLNAMAAALLFKDEAKRNDAVSMLSRSVRSAFDTEDADLTSKKGTVTAVCALADMLSVLGRTEDADELLSEAAENAVVSADPFILQAQIIFYSSALENADASKPFLGLFGTSVKEKYTERLDRACRAFSDFAFSGDMAFQPFAFSRACAVLKEKGYGDVSLTLAASPLLNSPDNPAAVRRLADHFLREKDHINTARAIAAEMRLRPSPPDRVLIYMYAECMFAGGDHRRALKAFAACERLGIKNPEMSAKICESLLVLNRPSAAAQRAASLPQSISSLYTQATAFIRCGQHTRAYIAAIMMFELFKNTPAFNIPKDRTSLALFAATTADMAKDVLGTEKYLRIALECTPDDPDLLNFLGYAFAEAGKKLDEAQKLIERSLEIRPGDAAVTDSLAWVLFRKKEYAKAKENIDKAISILEKEGNAVDGEILEHAGDIYRALGMNEKALAFWEDAVLWERQDASKRPALRKKIERLKSRTAK